MDERTAANGDDRAVGLGLTARKLLVAGGYLVLWLLLWRLAALFELLPWASAWYPPAGLTLGALVIFGPRFAGVVLVAEAVGALLLGQDEPHVWLPSILLGAGVYTLGAWALRRFLGGDHGVHRLIDVVGLCGIAASTAGVTAFLVMARFAVAGLVPWDEYLEGVLGFWIGDLVGVLMVTPFLLMYAPPLGAWVSQRDRRRPAQSDWIRRLEAPPLTAWFAGEVLLLALMVGGTLWLVFGPRPAAGATGWYLLLLPVLWIALRFGLPGASAGIVAINLALVAAVGLLGGEPPALPLHLFALAIALTGLLTGTVVSDHRRANARLRESEEEYRTLVEDQTDLICRFLPDTTLTFLNAACASYFGRPREEMLGKKLLDFVPEDQHPEVFAHLASFSPERPAIRAERQIRGSEGKLRWLVWNDHAYFDGQGRTTHFQSICTDVTEQREAEEHLRQAQKMEVIGQLTGGVAHDFNNILAAIMGQVELIEMSVDDPDVREGAAAVLEMVERGARLTRQLLAFSRRQPLMPQHVRLGELLAETSELFERTLGETVDVRTDRVDERLTVEVDPTQLQTALLNLALNARHAMPDGGLLHLAAEETVLDGRTARAFEVEPGPYVTLSVRDTGTGMPPDVLERAVDPFFTTRDVGQGSGLGLSMVYGFVKQSRGHLTLDSEPGQGTTVRLYLPGVAPS